ncbi:MAG: hypothetical protein WCF25_04255 [Acidimicrobiales bacterium]
MKRPIVLSAMAAIVITVTMLGGAGSASTASRKADVALARKALVVLSDFPSGWTTSPYSNSGSSPGLKQIASCLHVPVSVVNYNAPEADSPYFNETALNLQVQDSVDVFPSVKIATQQFNLLSGKSLGCVSEVFNSPAVKAMLTREIGKGAKVGTITASALPSPAPDNESNAFLLRVPGTYRGVTLTVEIETVTIMAKSKTEGAQLTFNFSSFSKIPSTLIAHLEAVTVERLG